MTYDKQTSYDNTVGVVWYKLQRQGGDIYERQDDMHMSCLWRRVWRTNKTLLKRAVLAYARHSPANVRASSVEVSLL